LPATVNSVLVLCHGNIMRSPFAAARLRASLRTVEVTSAGLAARPGREIEPRARDEATRHGVDLAGHQARAVEAHEVARADLVVVMDRLNEARLLARFPACRAKARLLGAFDPIDPRPEIADPYTTGATELRACFERIDRAVARLADAIAGQTPGR
jgi:protein-tyrosine phosphatase